MSQPYSQHLTYHAIIQNLVAYSHAIEHGLAFCPITLRRPS